jgi:hypothetical protein
MFRLFITSNTPTKKMNGLPFIQTAENIFYLESGPAYQDHAIGLAATTNKNDTNQQRSVPARIGINRSFIVPGGIVRILLIVSYRFIIRLFQNELLLL